MQFKEGMDVVNRAGEKMGSIDRIVIEPGSGEVTHVVVRKGFLLPEDKVVPVEMLVSASEDEVQLRSDVEDLDGLPPFEERHYIPWQDEVAGEPYPPGGARPYAWYPPAGTAWWGYPGYAGYAGYAPYVTPSYVEQNIPEGTVALKDGARVISADGEHVGDIERTFVDSGSNRMTHFVISEGLIFKTKKLVPTAWVRDVSEDEVHLSVHSRTLDRLEEFKEA